MAAVSRGVLTAKQEAFVKAYMKIRNYGKAWVEAGFKDYGTASHNSSKGWSLARIPKIQHRIEEASGKAAEAAATDGAWVFLQQREIYKGAMLNCDFTNANRAMENVAKLLGMFVDRKIEERRNLNLNDPLLIDEALGRIAAAANIELIEAPIIVTIDATSITTEELPREEIPSS